MRCYLLCNLNCGLFVGIEIDSIDETRFSLFARTQDVMDEAKQWINNVLKDFDVWQL